MFYNLSARDYIKSMISPQEKIRKNIRNLCCQQIEIIRCTPICLWVKLHPCNHHEDCSHGFWSGGGGALAGCSVAFAWKFYPLRSWPCSSSTPGRRDGCFQFQAHGRCLLPGGRDWRCFRRIHCPLHRTRKHFSLCLCIASGGSGLQKSRGLVPAVKVYGGATSGVHGGGFANFPKGAESSSGVHGQVPGRCLGTPESVKQNVKLLYKF